MFGDQDLIEQLRNLLKLEQFVNVHTQCRQRKQWGEEFEPWMHLHIDLAGPYQGQQFLIIIIIRVFCPKAGPSLQAEKPRLQFY